MPDGPGVRPAGGRRRRGRAGRGGHRGPPRAGGDRGREGAGARRGDGLVGRLDVGAAEPAVAGRRDRRGRRGARAPTSSTRSGEHYDEPRVDALLHNARHMVAFFETPHRAAVRVRQLDRRHPGQPARRRHRRPLGRAEADQRPALRPELRAHAPPAAVRDLVPGHGHHGRARPAGLPARHHLGARVRRTRPGGSPSTCSTWSPTGGGCSWSTARRWSPGWSKSADERGVRLLGRARRRPRLTTEDGRGHRRGRWPPRTATVPVRAAAGCAAGRRRLPPRCRAPPRGCSRAPRPAGSTGPSRRRRPPATGSSLGESVGGRLDTALASPAAWCPVSLVPLPQRPGRRVPAHRRPRQARPDRGAVHREALRQRGRRLPPVHDGHDRRDAAGGGGGVLAGLRPRLPAALPVRHGQAVPRADLAVPPVRLPDAGPHPRRSWPSGAGSTRSGWPRTVAEFNRHARVGEDPQFQPGQHARSTAAPATRTTGPTRRWRRSRRRRSTRSRCCRAASAPSPGCGPTRSPGCWTPTARRSRGSTRPAATRPT